MTELQQRYEAETGQPAIECIDVSTMGHRVITRATERFLEWTDEQMRIKEKSNENQTA